MPLGFRYLLAFLFTFGSGAIVSAFTAPEASTWYTTLALPTLIAIPAMLFAPAWTISYSVQAISFARIFKIQSTEEERQWVMTFIFQLICCMMWSLLFFGYHALILAMIVALMLYISLILLLLKSWEAEKISFYLLLPHLLWGTLLAILSINAWWAN